MHKKTRKNTQKIKLSKETQEERKQRMSSGIRFRSSVFDDKRRKKQEKQLKDELKKGIDE